MIQRLRWTVNVPIEDLLSIMHMSSDIQRILEDNAALRREMQGLRSILSEVMITLGDVKRSRKQG